MLKIQIINTNNNADNILLTDGLTIELLKVRYNWFLNASVKNCIIGENSDGLVWYSGEWICGEWENGTWYSGIWYDGTWKNGKWYSYLIDRLQALQSRLVILEKNETYSQFRSGDWKQGDWYDGTFGDDINISNKSFGEVTGKTFASARWENGKFYDGIIKNAVWLDGVFYYGDISNSYWVNGRFYNGTFSQYIWFDGLWYGGDFKQGNWKNGKFDQVDPNIKSRFGIDTTISTLYNIWWNGTFSNGEFHSGLNLDASGKTLPSKNNGLSQWYNGNFNGGKWYGGHFRLGNFNNGYWYGGVFNTDTGSTNYTNCIWNNGYWYDGLWINGTFKKGHFYCGMWLDGIFEYGYLSNNIIESGLLPISAPTPIYAPTVLTFAATNISYYSAYGNGRVSNNGGANILDRGFCYGVTNIDLTTGSTVNNRVSDGGTMGDFSIKMNNLAQNNTYYFRAYAKNRTGVTYGEIFSFNTTIDPNTSAPFVITNPATNVISNDADMNGFTQSNGSTISECGFYYGTDVYPLITGTQLITYTVQSGYFSGNTSGLLTPNTYYYLAYATNGVGTTYGLIQSFIVTSDVPTKPTVSTLSVDNISSTTAISHCSVDSNGNASITERGICWSLNLNPTTLDNKVVVAGTTGAYDANISGLSNGTTYHVRGYATNSEGTGYGSDIEFVTLTTPTVIVVQIEPL